MRSLRTLRLIACCLALAATPVGAWTGLVDFSTGLLDYAARRFGFQAPGRLQTMQTVVRNIKTNFAVDFKQAVEAPNEARAEMPLLRKVNDFYNQVPYLSDQEHWNVEDYWATPVEFVGSFGGDCEDYAIAKYMTLKFAGVPIERLRITYVRAIRLGVTHMVLAYYPTPDAEPWILDNLIGEIKKASARTDLVPVYSFNDDDLWMASGAVNKGSATNVRLWKDLLEKMVREQRL
ncbi:sulfate adenylyltransferase [Duganella sp. FT50W]|uniref:Sulfate adenylyltransferase n=1 Tax=Duganella lactea TaxID=2692173 RepID=A0A6L8MM15_9BURK|nr:transglutaminase-like cysteine peptidase [Duganella lactea]MYM82962.1 sulfate adenylyltransferase [Duganella lactea]